MPQNDSIKNTSGVVFYSDMEIPFRIVNPADPVHVLAFSHKSLIERSKAHIQKIDHTWIEQWRNSEALREHFTAEEHQSILHPEAAYLRFCAKIHIARDLGYSASVIEIIRPITPDHYHPPYLRINGQRSEIDISLSHHGSYVAWAALL